MTDAKLRKAFREICLGRSECVIYSKPAFIKHFSAVSTIDAEEKHALFLEQALSDGMPSNKDIESRLVQDGLWTRSDEDKINSKHNEIELLKKSSKMALLPSEKERVQSQISEKLKILSELKSQKNSLIGRTAETVADQKIYDYILLNSFFKDDSLQEPLFSEDDFDNIPETELHEVYSKYRAYSDLINEECVKKIVVAPFFNMYYAFLDTPNDFYGKSAVFLTSSQMNLFIYAKIAKNVIDRNEHMPEEVRKDFDAILDYDDTKQKAEKMAPDTGHQHQVIFGANKKDMKYLGGDAEGNVAKRTLKALADKGGSLTMAEMAKIHGKIQ